MGAPQLALMELFEKFPTEGEAEAWLKKIFWPQGRSCGHCGSTNTIEAPRPIPMPYWCRDCRHYFSLRTGTPLARSKVPLQKWVIAIYLVITRGKGISSCQLARDLKVRQSTAWFMLHRIREAWIKYEDEDDDFDGPVEVDEMYVGGLRRFYSLEKRKEIPPHEAIAEKEIVLGVRDQKTKRVHAEVVPYTSKEVAARFVGKHVKDEATVYADDSRIYIDLPNPRETVNHSAYEYARGEVHINGMESFWSMFKKGYRGVFHKISPKHLNRYLQEFCGRHNTRELGTLSRMATLVVSMRGRSLTYRDLIADNGLPSGSRTKSPRKSLRSSPGEEVRISPVSLGLPLNSPSHGVILDGLTGLPVME